ncbi:MAG: DUF4339 domain-containing protein [Clostridia bacterium]|nr:DUF4339 domain-containing protein [Clostridia bacterium]
MEWHLYRNGEQSGPFSEEQLFQMAREGRFQGTDLVWNQKMSDWTPADNIPGLMDSSPDLKTSGPGPADSVKETILQEILKHSDAGPFSITRGSDTDVLITNEVTNSSWFSGKKKVVYTAQILLKESEKTAYYWEMLKETSSGISFQVGFQKRKIKGVELFQQSREKGYAPDGGLVYDYQFDYGTLREAFKQLVGQHGWKLKVVLARGKTTY